MTMGLFLLAQAPPPDVTSDGLTVLSLNGHELFLLSLAVGAVAVLVVLWAVFIRKPDRPGHRRRRHHSEQGWGLDPAGIDDEDEGTEKKTVDEAEVEDDAGHGRRRRRRRREHRPRNPTLAETGGLPPIRSSKPPLPPP